MTASSPTVSVVIPVYNRAGTIRASIESVLRQTWTDFELLIVDDGSTDATMAEAARLADPRIRFLSNPRNLGAAAARNTGIRAARGAWVAFQDSDDEWLPRKLEKQMARLTAPGSAYVAAYCGMLILNPLEQQGTQRLQIKYLPRSSQVVVEDHILIPLLRANFVSTQTLIARRSRLEQIGGFDEELRVMEDWDCVLRLAQLGSVACVDEPLVIQTFSVNSITRDTPRHVETLARLIDKHMELLGKHPDALVHGYYQLAGGHRHLGDLPAARSALAKARAVQPLNPRLWMMTAYVTALGLLRRGA